MTIAQDVDHIAGSGGVALRRRRWRGPSPTRALAIVHGLAEHSARYAHVGEFFATRGYAVHAFDQRGHGESEGPRMHTPDFDTLLDDIERFLDATRRDSPGLPLVLLGHSMGGLEVASLLVRRRPALDAAVLSGPALAVGGTGVKLVAARALASLWPTLRLPSGLDANAISRDPAVVAAYRADPLVPTTIAASLGAALLGEAAQVQGRGSDVAVPLLVVHGEADALCPVAGSREFCAQVTTPGSELRTYPGLYHEVFNEPERDSVLADVASWLDKNLASER